MRAWNALLVLCFALAAPACTPGAPAPGGGSGAAAPAPSTVTIDVSLTAASSVSTAFGTAGGFTPSVTTVPIGSSVRFVNVDAITHTSSSFGAGTFPAQSPLSGAALSTFGGTLSGGWSSGILSAGTTSQLLLADEAGTYLYGCFFHYDASPPMRGAIVVR